MFEEEVVDGYNVNGEFVSVCRRSVVTHPERTGLYCQSGNILFIRDVRINMRTTVREFAIAIRAPHKKMWPGCLDFTVSGASDPGETALETALREASEEVKINLEASQLALGASWVPKDGFNSVGSVYLHRHVRGPIKFNTDDIASIVWKTEKELMATARYSKSVMKPDLRAFILSEKWAKCL